MALLISNMMVTSATDMRRYPCITSRTGWTGVPIITSKGDSRNSALRSSPTPSTSVENACWPGRSGMDLPRRLAERNSVPACSP